MADIDATDTGTAIVPAVAVNGAGLPVLLTPAQERFLTQKTPPHAIKKRQGRGKQFSYVEGGYVVEVLNQVFGFNWDFVVEEHFETPEECVVLGKLTVRTPSGQVITKTQWGGMDIERFGSGPKAGQPLSVADTLKGASTDSLKKCASLLGIGLDVTPHESAYEDGDDAPAPAPSQYQPQRQQQYSKPAPAPAPAPQYQEPQVEVLTPMCTRAQQHEITTLARAVQKDMRELCQSLGVAHLGELTEAKAQRVINRLRELEAGTGQQMPPQPQPPQLQPQLQQPPQTADGDYPFYAEERVPPSQVRNDQALTPVQPVHFPAPFHKNGPKASEKQVKAFFAIGRAEVNWSGETVKEVARERYGLEVDELTRPDASDFIDYMKGTGDYEGRGAAQEQHAALEQQFSQHKAQQGQAQAPAQVQAQDQGRSPDRPAGVVSGKEIKRTAEEKKEQELMLQECLDHINGVLQLTEEEAFRLMACLSPNKVVGNMTNHELGMFRDRLTRIKSYKAAMDLVAMHGRMDEAEKSIFQGGVD